MDRYRPAGLDDPQHDPSTTSTIPDAGLRSTFAGMRYELPDRYHEYTSLQERLWRELPPLHAGQRILDVGAGRLPTIPCTANRPANVHYVGLDVSGEALRAATSGAYDEILVSDIGVRRERVPGTYDLAISLNTLEHVTDLEHGGGRSSVATCDRKDTSWHFSQAARVARDA